MKLNFSADKDGILSAFKNIKWNSESGLEREELAAEILKLEETNQPKSIIKASSFDLICRRGQIAVNKHDIFQDKISGAGIIAEQRKRWETSVKLAYLPDESAEIDRSWKKFGAYEAHGDYGHTSPNSEFLLSAGFTGLLRRIERASQKDGLNKKNKEFYLSCEIVIKAMITATRRLADATLPYNKDNAEALYHISDGAPQNIYEAMQLLILYFYMHEYIGGTRVRTLGRLDVLFRPFYESDIKSGRFTKAEIKELLKYFLYKFSAMDVRYDLPFCLGGMDNNAKDTTDEVSYLIVEAYDELNIHSPKIHIRVCDKTPGTFIRNVLDCIRRGNSSFVFINDNIAIESLTRVGISEADARNYVPIGCYEPAVWGVEIGCTGNGGVNLPKAVELVFNDGHDFKSGLLCGISTGIPSTYGEFLSAVKRQIEYMTSRALNYIVKIEGHYREINPEPILSAQYDSSVERGIDLYEGGAKYNNSSLYFYSIASLTDEIAAVKKLVFEEKRFTFTELGDILRADWNGHEKERLKALNLHEKYGNGDPVADEIARDISRFCANLVNNKPNGRGGVFKAALFTIDFCFYSGKRTMATPEGRHAGEPLSKNLCASVGMDRAGITALIKSVTNIDLADFSTGSVLDILLHPSAVSGDDGLMSFYSILMSYFEMGGFAMHGNIFDAQTLKNAQNHPEKYKNLQVRVCGWNVYFVNLSKEEQDCFIRQAELR